MAGQRLPPSHMLPPSRYPHGVRFPHYPGQPPINPMLIPQTSAIPLIRTPMQSNGPPQQQQMVYQQMQQQRPQMIQQQPRYLLQQTNPDGTVVVSTAGGFLPTSPQPMRPPNTQQARYIAAGPNGQRIPLPVQTTIPQNLMPIVASGHTHVPGQSAPNYGSFAHTPNLAHRPLNSSVQSHAIRQALGHMPPPQITNRAGPDSDGVYMSSSGEQLLEKKSLEDLVKEVDPHETLEEDVKEALLQLTDEFVDKLLGDACKLAKHRESEKLEVRDVQLAIERHWNMWIPGLGNDELRPYKKACVTDAHKQRMALIKKTLKKP